MKLFFYLCFLPKRSLFFLIVSVKLLTVVGQFQSETDQNLKQFQWNWPKLETEKCWLPVQFKKYIKKPCTCWWNFPAFGIEKNGPTYAEFEAWPKFDFSSFKTKKFPAFFKNGRDFWDKKKKKSAHFIFFIKNLKKNPFAFLA